MRRRSLRRFRVKAGRNVVIGKQSANASNNQGGNSIAINAFEVGIVRIRPRG